MTSINENVIRAEITETKVYTSVLSDTTISAQVQGYASKGLSAYQVWLAQGNTGSELDFLASLEGEQGPAGTNGIDGETGPAGPTIISAEFSGDDIVFTKSDSSTVILEDAKLTLKGDTGSAGTDGTDGREIELQVTETYVQWRYVGDVSWTNLIAISAITGPQGIQGIQGLTGDTGATGNSGVYIGEEEPIDEEVNVWIDTNDESLITTADVADSTNRRYVTDAQLTVIQNTEGTNTGDQEATDFDINDLTDSTSLRNTWNGKQDAINIPQYAVPYRDLSGNGTVNTHLIMEQYGATEGRVPIKTTGGAIITGTPTADNHSATKLYVDTGLGQRALKTEVPTKLSDLNDDKNYVNKTQAIALSIALGG